MTISPDSVSDRLFESLPPPSTRTHSHVSSYLTTYSATGTLCTHTYKRIAPPPSAYECASNIDPPTLQIARKRNARERGCVRAEAGLNQRRVLGTEEAMEAGGRKGEAWEGTGHKSLEKVLAQANDTLAAVKQTAVVLEDAERAAEAVERAKGRENSQVPLFSPTFPSLPPLPPPSPPTWPLLLRDADHHMLDFLRRDLLVLNAPPLLLLFLLLRFLFLVVRALWHYPPLTGVGASLLLLQSLSAAC